MARKFTAYDNYISQLAKENKTSKAFEEHINKVFNDPNHPDNAKVKKFLAKDDVYSLTKTDVRRALSKKFRR